MSMTPATSPPQVPQQPVFAKWFPRGSGHWVLAVFLLVTFLVTVIFALIAARDKTQWENTRNALNILLPVETGFLGSVMGYYFGFGKQSSDLAPTHIVPKP